MTTEPRQVLSILGKQKVLDALFQLVSSSKNEVCITTQYLGSRWGEDEQEKESYYAQFENSISLARKRKSKVRIIGGTREAEAEQRLVKRGAEVRYLNHGALRFVVKDTRECMVVSSEQFAENLHFYQAVWTSYPEFSVLLQRHFDDLWSQAEKPSNRKSK